MGRSITVLLVAFLFASAATVSAASRISVQSGGEQNKSVPPIGFCFARRAASRVIIRAASLRAIARCTLPSPQLYAASASCQSPNMSCRFDR